MPTTKKTVQEKTKELTELVEWFDSDEFSLEVALETFKKAEELATEIEDDLMNLKNEIRIVKQKFDEEE